MNINELRVQYKKGALQRKDLDQNPIIQFKQWFQEALNAQIQEPNAFSLATVKDNKPSSRIVLLKEITSTDFIFFTNYLSAKGQAIASNPYVSMNFFWHELERQVCIEGIACKSSRAISEKYFYSRPLGSQIGAIISPQSEIINDNKRMLQMQEYLLLHTDEIKCPLHWGAYNIQPHKMEFWQGRPNRLHDRYQYIKNNDVWKIVQLAP